MPANYNLDTKIEALNLLDQHDGDLHLVKDRLGTLRGWRTDQDKAEDRQYRHFANIKLTPYFPDISRLPSANSPTPCQH